MAKRVWIKDGKIDVCHPMIVVKSLAGCPRCFRLALKKSGSNGEHSIPELEHTVGDEMVLGCPHCGYWTNVVAIEDHDLVTIKYLKKWGYVLVEPSNIPFCVEMQYVIEPHSVIINKENGDFRFIRSSNDLDLKDGHDTAIYRANWNITSQAVNVSSGTFPEIDFNSTNLHTFEKDLLNAPTINEFPQHQQMVTPLVNSDKALDVKNINCVRDKITIEYLDMQPMYKCWVILKEFAGHTNVTLNLHHGGLRTKNGQILQYDKLVPGFLGLDDFEKSEAQSCVDELFFRSEVEQLCSYMSRFYKLSVNYEEISVPFEHREKWIFAFRGEVFLLNEPGKIYTLNFGVVCGYDLRTCICPKCIDQKYVQ